MSRRHDIKRLDHARVLMYSHDTFGLGHLRRCRAIAHAIVERFKGVSVLIISGSQIAGAYDYRARVDFVKIPSVIKLAFELTDRITVLHYGKVVADGFSHEVKSNPLVQEIYLGAGLEDA